MRNKNLWSFMTLLLLVAMLVTACGATEAPPAEPTAAPQEPAAPEATEAEAEPEYTTEGKVIYNVGWLKGHPVIRLMTLGFILGAQDLGYEYKLLLSDGADINKYIQDMEQANAEGAAAVVAYVHDPAMGPSVAALGESGIPFCSAHFPQPEGQYPGLTAWVSTETEPYAQAAARAMGDELRRRGVTSGSIAITEGSFNTVENLVAETFAATIAAEYPEFKTLEAQEEGFDPPPAIAKAAAIIQANPDIVGALSTTGAGPTTWARAAEENGLPDGQIVIISMDYTRPNLDLVQEGKVFGLVGQPLVEEFRECVHVMDKVLRGEPYNYANPLPAPIITLANIDKYYEFNDMVEAQLGAEPTAVPTEAPEAGAGDNPDTPWVEMTPEEMGCKYGEGGTCRVVLSNSFIGNDWRIQMQNTAKAAAKYEPFASTFDFEILNTEYSPEAQNAALDNLLLEGVDVVLLDAYGPAAHNDWIERAVEQGVKVVSFDIVSDSELDYKVDWDFYTASKYAGLWFAKELGCQGKYVMDEGLPATAIAEAIAQGGRDAIVEICPDGGLEEVGTFYGEFAEGPMEPAVSSFLATEPILDGVYTQGYCTTVVSAYEAAGRLESDNPVLYCQGYNSNFVLLAEGKARGVITAGSPAISIMAMQTAYEALTGREPPTVQMYVLGVYATNTDHDIGIPYEQIETGVNAFPDLPGGFSSVMNITNSPPNPVIWVQITMDDLIAAGQEF